MFIVDLHSRQPIYEQITQGITRLVALGGLLPGQQLPSVREFAEQQGLSPNTVQKAYGLLEREGIITSAPGRGTFISLDASAVSQIKRTALDKLGQSVGHAVEVGVTPGEIHAEVNQYLERNGTNND